ncbi:MAG: UvrD-helicase domain-containing protein [Rickettsiales bacterium]
MIKSYLEASDPTKNIWVSASAGSGKTKLLVDRVLRILLSGQPPESILCITFTKSASSEMYERIKDVLFSWFQKEEKDLIADLQGLNVSPTKTIITKARHLIYKILDDNTPLKISTIHSLCQDIINTFPYESGIAGDFQILDENDKCELINQAALDILKQKLPKESNVNFLFENLSERSFFQLIEELMSYENESSEWTDIEENYARLVKRVEEYFKLESRINYPKNIDALALRVKFTCAKFSEHIDDISVLSELNEAIKINNPEKLLDSLVEILYTQSYTPRKRLLTSHQTSKAGRLENELISIQNDLSDILEEKYAIYQARLSKSLCELRIILHRHYNKLKIQKGFIDYNDLIRYASHLLSVPRNKSAVFHKIFPKLRHILVDESQDTSIEQWKIILSLKEEILSDENSSIFVVGDEKQSIYSFQGSSPIIFSAIEEKIKEYLKTYKKSLSKVHLNSSFRTSQLILDCVDEIFSDINYNFSSPLTQNYIKHISRAKQNFSKIEVSPTIIPLKREKIESRWILPTEHNDSSSPLEINANLVASKVKSLVESGENPEDIMILVQKRDRHTLLISRLLKEKNIPFSGLDRISLTNNIIVKDLISFGKFLLFQYDDLNLAALLKSPIFDVSEENLYKLCYKRKNDVWKEILNSEQQEILHVQKVLKYYLEFSTSQIFDLYFDLLVKKGIKQKYLSEYGSVAEDIINHFLDICESQQNKHNGSLLNFLDWLEKTQIIIKQEANLSSENVNLLTIHGAKGLQSKIVILADAVSTPRPSGNQFWDSVNNIPIYGVNSPILCKEFQESKKINNEKIISEYYRLLYVAITRAKDQLYIFGYSNYQSLPQNSWMKYIIKTCENTLIAKNISDIFGYDLINKNANNFANTLSTKKYFIQNNIEPVRPLRKKTTSSKNQITLNFEDFKNNKSIETTNQNYDLEATSKGVMMHKILEHIISEESYDLTEIIFNHSKKFHMTLNKSERIRLENFIRKVEDMISSSNQVMKEKAFLFNKDGKYRKGVADLIIIKGDLIKILDYKFSARTEETQKNYKLQLEYYKEALEKIYTAHRIECYLGWINESLIEQII